MAVVVLPLPLGPVRQTTGFCRLFIRMLAAAELILSWKTSSQRSTKRVSSRILVVMFSMSITRIAVLLSGGAAQSAAIFTAVSSATRIISAKPVCRASGESSSPVTMLSEMEQMERPRFFV